jgi:hypothetical protein
MQRSTSPSSQPGGRGTATAVVAPLTGGIGSRTSASPFTEAIGPADDAYEREADRVADAVVRGARARGDRVGWSAASAPTGTIQRAPKEGAPQEAAAPETAPAPPSAVAEIPAPAAMAGAPAALSEAPQTEPAAAGAAPAPALLVDDEGEVGRGQMRKAEFLAALRAEVCATVDAGLSGTGRDSDGCPWIDHWFGYYEGRSASQIERSVRRYAPDARGAATARDYIQSVTARIRRSVSIFAKTGEITGMPDDMPGSSMPGGGLLGAFGGMFFKARPGGPRQADPASVREELGNGESLPGSLRKRMESAFGTSFAGVRLHTDTTAAHLSDRLNARAFAVGEHVAFAGGEFQPGTMAGDALIAHELAHVVQQGHGAASGGGLFHKGETGGGQSYSALEDDADVSAVGAVATLWTGARGRLSDVGRHAMPRMRSGLQLQRCGGAKPAEGPKSQARLTVRETRDQSIQNAGERLRDVNNWATGQVKPQGVREVKAVRDLPADAQTKVAEAIQLLTKAQSLFGTKELDALPPKLDEVTKQAGEAYAKSGASDIDNSLLRQKAMGQAINAADEAAELVTKLSPSFDVTDVAKKVDEIVTILNGLQAGKYDWGEGIDRIRKNVKDAKTSLRELRERFGKTPEAIGRVLFVLKNFLALNAPGKATPPTAEEIKTFKGTLENASEDFSTVFAEGKVTQGFAVFVSYAEVLQQQLAVRDKMAAAGVKAASPIPTQGNAEDWFKTLKGKPNKEVFEAYTTYAQAFFYHRVVDVFHDMEVTGVEDFFQRPLSIAGLRPLVCTGYALLGSHLLRFAGAKLLRFIVAVRARDDDIANDRLEAGHAVALMNLNGQDFFVSNYEIVFDENHAIGPNAVAWHDSTADLRKRSGATIPGTNAALGAHLDDLKQQILKKRAKAASKPAAVPVKKK